MSSKLISQVVNERILNSVKRMDEMVQNEYTLRRDFFSQHMDARRSINHECGYPDSGSITLETHYAELYGREGIATRVVDIFPDECWAVHPELFETEDVAQETAFEQAFAGLNDNLSEMVSWYADGAEKSSPFWETMHRVDRLCGVGAYGAILIQFDDKQDPLQPMKKGGAKQCLGLRPLDQSCIRVNTYDSDRTSRRYGKPQTYTVSFNDATTNSEEIGGVLSTVEVHWTRIIHVADNIGSNEFFGVPRMQPVLNRLLDLRKLLGGSAEMYWKGAFMGISFETHPQISADDLDADFQAAMKSQLEAYQNGMQRYLLSGAMTAKSLAPQVVSPLDQIAAQVDAVCIALDVPKRIFVGSERGELSSSQDAKKWNRRLSFRQNNFCTPRIVIPLVDRLIWAGVLPEPSEGYQVRWPDLNTTTEGERADVLVKRAEAMAKFSTSDVPDVLMSQHDYLTREMGYNAEEADEILANVMENLVPIPEPEPVLATELAGPV
jgi:uncharacterized protein